MNDNKMRKECMKIITMYLPQFHRTKENDEWWGDGYTDWEAVKSATPLFKGHNQPRVPYNNYYYDLLDKKTMEWQASLMSQYSIYGQCFYHYWFKDGKKVLNKPAENLLAWKDINMPFCFCWANEAWVRSWSAIVDSNVWAPGFESFSQVKGKSGVLLEQDYGDAKEWRSHFEYLLPFFQDDRYIKVDGKPVIVIYRPDNIPCLEEMVDLWNDLSREYDFPGVYIIGGNTEKKKNMDARYVHMTGSMFPAKLYELINGVKTIRYEKVWDFINEYAQLESGQTFIGGIVDFDTTARKGKNGAVILGCDAEIYESGLRKLLKTNEEHGVPFTFINAWNEWGEGMYLEPDEKNGYSFLKATKEAISTYREEQIALNNIDSNLIQVYKIRANQYKQYWRLMDRWMTKKEMGTGLAISLEQLGYSKVAIYGIGILGNHLSRDLQNSRIEIKYYIDTRKSGVKDGIPIVSPDFSYEDIDVIIVSVVNEFEEIKKFLTQFTDKPIVSLEELVFDETIG